MYVKKILSVMLTFLCMTAASCRADNVSSKLCKKSFNHTKECSIDAGAAEKEFIRQCGDSNRMSKEVSSGCWAARAAVLECSTKVECRWLTESMDDEEHPCHNEAQEFRMQCMDMWNQPEDS